VFFNVSRLAAGVAPGRKETTAPRRASVARAAALRDVTARGEFPFKSKSRAGGANIRAALIGFWLGKVRAVPLTSGREPACR
jgi:hypothetical protein